MNEKNGMVYKWIIIPILLLCMFSSNAFASSYKQRGKASYYAHDFHGKHTASGKKFHMYELTAAHKTLPFGTKVKVTNLSNGKHVVVEITDRGPYSKGRIIDLSYEAARQIGMIQKGVQQVEIQTVKSKKKKRHRS